jgi:peptide/nickel transport system substrate-binding protein
MSSWASGGKVVKVDRVEWRYIPEAVTAAQALGAGEVDYWENVPSDYAPALERDTNIVIRSNAGALGTVRFNHLNLPFSDIRMWQAVLMVADQRDYLSAMAGDPKSWRTCFSFYACDGAEPDELGGEALSGPRDFDKAKRLIGEAGYKGDRVVVLDAADIPQLHAEALVTNDLLQRLGLNVELATAEWGTVIKRVRMREPVERGGWNVMNTVFAYYGMITRRPTCSCVRAVSPAQHPAGRRTRKSKPCARPGSPPPTMCGGAISPIRSSSARSNSCLTFRPGNSSADARFGRT